MSETNQVTDLFQITSRLTGTLEREVEMLRAMKPAEIQSLRQDKIALSAAYEARIKSLKANPEVLRSISPELRADLKAAIEKFRVTLLENERSLHAAKETTERALKAIAQEAQMKTQRHAGYSAQGTVIAPGQPGRTSALSFAFDQRL